MSGRVLAAACLAQLMITLDVSVVNIALPAVRADLGLGIVGQQWVVTAYALPFAGFLLIGGRFADLVGVRTTFGGGMALFTAASVVAGAAPDPGVLLAGRALQGLAAAFVAPAALALVTTTFEEGEARTRALAWWTAMSIAGGTAGNLCGGVLTEAFGWRSVLLVNVPLGVIASTLARRAPVPAGTARSRARRGRLDVGAAVLVTTALMTAAFGFGAMGERRWTAGGAVLVTAVILFAAFVRRDRRSPLPMVPAGVLKGRGVRWGNVGILLAGAALVPMWFFLSLQLQVVLGYPPVIAGIAFLPHTVIQLIVGLRCTPRLLQRYDATALVAVGSLLLAAGFAWQSRLVPESDYVAAVLLPAVLIAVGAGVMNLPLTTMTVAGVPDSMAGIASGIMNCAKQIGGGIGLAVLVAATAGIAEPATAYGAAFVIMAGLVAAIGVGAVLVERSPQPGNGSSV